MIKTGITASLGTYNTDQWDEIGIYAGPNDGEIYDGGNYLDIYSVGKSVNPHRMEEKRKAMSKSFHDGMIQKVRQTGTDVYATGTIYDDTSGSIDVLIPIFLQPEIRDIVRKEAPLFEMLKKVAIKGMTYEKDVLSTRNTAAFKNDDAAQDVKDDTVTRVTVRVKYAYAVGRVTGPIMATSRAFIDIERHQIESHTRALVELIEDKIFNGDASANSEEFSGLSTLLTTNSITVSAALDIDKIRNYIRRAKQGAASSVTGTGHPDLIVVDLATFDDIKKLLQSFLRYNDTNNLKWGVQAVWFEGIPIISSAFLDVTGGSKELYVLDTSTLGLAILQDITFERLAKVNDSNKFFIRWYGALFVEAEKFNTYANTIT